MLARHIKYINCFVLNLQLLPDIMILLSSLPRDILFRYCLLLLLLLLGIVSFTRIFFVGGG